MKKLLCMMLSFALILGCAGTAFAESEEQNCEYNLLLAGDDICETEIRPEEDEEEQLSDFVIAYGYEYIQGNKKNGQWRDGPSGGSAVSPANLSLTYSDNTEFNISFTATVSGSYTNGATIGGALGVTLGASRSYSLGSGYSVPVPAGAHYQILYRPQYYQYTVIETKYMERYNPALGGMERYAIGTKTCYVDVFSNWDFTHIAN